jgi:hypothetical protein
MAMSQGELIWRRQQESKRFLSRQQTKDSSLQTYINQAKASTTIFTPTPTKQSIQGSTAVGPVEKGLNNNTYQATPVQPCCSVTYASGNETFNERSAVEMKNTGAVLCCQPDYAQTNGYSIDLRTLGAYCCPLPNLPNTAKVPESLQCAACLKFYFPVPAQPSICSGCSTPYPQSSLYPPKPIDWELQRYGEAGVPRVGGSTGLPTNLIT